MGCTDPLSENYDENASIDDGSCVFARDKFIGSYNVVSDDCVNGTYTIRIDPSSNNAAKIIISNLNKLSSLTVIGSVSESSFVIEPTNFNGQTVSGNGQINGSVLNVIYQVTNSDGSTFSCPTSANKQ